MPVLIGTSGWQYKDWRGAFYPQKLAQGRWLEHYAERFAVVEINSTFYRLPSPETFSAWRERTPSDFRLAVKASRYITHIRWRQPKEPISRFLDAATHLGSKLGPVLLQLRDTVQADNQALEEVLSLFPPAIRVAFEPRHPSWMTEEVMATLRRRNVALCLADSPHRDLPLWRSADWGYIRFHEGRGDPIPCYEDSVLDAWAERVSTLWRPEADVYVFFNNDPHGCAVRDARRFADKVRRYRLTPSRVPDASEVPRPELQTGQEKSSAEAFPTEKAH